MAADKDMEQVILRKQGRLNCAGEELEIFLAPRTAYYIKIIVTGVDEERGESSISCFETGKMEEPWNACWIGQQEGDRFHPMFEKKLSIKKPLEKARLYICGLGLYEAYIDGCKIGDEILAPFINDYSYALQAQTYDVTQMLHEDAVLSVMLGNGWYKGRIGYDGRSEFYGDRFALIAELVLTYEDGTEEAVGTDESWSYYGADIEYSDIYDGEGINRTLYEGRENPRRRAALQKIDTKLLVDRHSMPLKEMEDMPVKQVIHTAAGETVLDFGQNFAGYATFYADFPKGTRIVLSLQDFLGMAWAGFRQEDVRTTAELLFALKAE